jgi:hypothetical protein
MRLEVSGTWDGKSHPDQRSCEGSEGEHLKENSLEG